MQVWAAMQETGLPRSASQVCANNSSFDIELQCTVLRLQGIARVRASPSAVQGFAFLAEATQVSHRNIGS